MNNEFTAHKRLKEVLSVSCFSVTDIGGLVRPTDTT